MRSRHAAVGGGLAILGAVAVSALGSASAASGPARTWGAAFTGAPGTAQATDEPAPALHGKHIIQLFDQGTDDNAFVDVGPSGFSPGDYIVFRDNLLTPDQRQTVGDLNVTCMFMFDVANCHGTARLFGRGKITFEGTSPAGNRPFLLAITGGTREFQTARGEIRVAPIDDTNNALVSVRLD